MRRKIQEHLGTKEHMSEKSASARDNSEQLQIALQPIAALNADFLSLIMLPSHAHPWLEISVILSSHQDCIQTLIEACPFALFDVRLRDSQAWASALTSPVREDVQWPADYSSWRIHHGACFLAWSLARHFPSMAGFLLGISRDVIAILGAFDPIQLHEVSKEHPDWLQPRWCEQPRVWAELVMLAKRQDARSNDTLRERAFALLLGQLVG
jgi:hypothetical protein